MRSPVKELIIPHFVDGLNTLQDSTQIKDTEVQLLDNMEVRPINYTSIIDGSEGTTKLALTVRNSYKNLHTDSLPFIPKNLVEFQQLAFATSFFSQVNDLGNPNQDSTYIYTTTTANPVIFGHSQQTGIQDAFSAHPPVAGTIKVTVYIIATKRGAAGAAKAWVRCGGTNYEPTQVGFTLSDTFNQYGLITTLNPRTGLNWLRADVEGTGANPWQGFGTDLFSGNGMNLSAIYAKVSWTSGGVTYNYSAVLPSSDTLTATWTVFTVSGSKYLISGGYDIANNAFKVHTLLNGSSTTTLLKSQNAGGKYAVYDTGRCNFFKYNQYVYYNDGNFPWRKWDGTTESASGFTTVTMTGVIHKDRAWYGNDVTNTLPNYLYFSSVGTPETVSALNFFRIGEQTDPIVSLVDMQDHLLIVKEKSLWALYVSADLTNSILIRKNRFKGSPGALTALWTEKGLAMYTYNSGTQIVDNTELAMEPIFQPVFNLIRGTTFDTTAAFGYLQDQIWLATRGAIPVGPDTTGRVFILDTLLGKVYKNNLDISCFLIDSSSNTFQSRPKACLSAGKIIEFDHTMDADEPNITCNLQTKDFTFDMLHHRKNLHYVVLDAIVPDTVQAVNVQAVCDGFPVQSFTFNATTTGYNRMYFPFNPDENGGNKISVIVSFTQTNADETITERFAVLSMVIGYSVEERVQ